MTEKANLTPAEQNWAPAGADAGAQVIRAFSARIQTGREQQPHRVGTWRGIPGRYDRPTGMPWHETFVVYTGTGSIQFADEKVVLAPGTIVNLRKGVPYVMEITTTLEKMAVITEG